MKEENGSIARLLRHSDDFRLSSTSAEFIANVAGGISVGQNESVGHL